MAIIRTLALSVTARTNQFSAGLHRAGRDLDRFKARVGRGGLGAGGGGLGGLLAGAFAGLSATMAARGLLRIGSASLNSADRLAKMARRLDLAHDKLAGLELAADLAGVSVEDLDKGLAILGSRLSEARIGTGEAVRGLEALKLDARELAKLPLDVTLGRIADAMADVGDVSDRLRISRDLFGRGGTTMLSVLELRSAGLAEVQRRADALGITLKGLDLSAVEGLNDELTISKRAWSALGQSMTTIAAPGLLRVAEAANMVIEKLGGAREIGELLADTLTAVFVGGFFAPDLPARQRRMLGRILGHGPGKLEEIPRAAPGAMKLPPRKAPMDDESAAEAEARGRRPGARFARGELSPFVDPGALSGVRRPPAADPVLGQIYNVLDRKLGELIALMRAARFVP